MTNVSAMTQDEALHDSVACFVSSLFEEIVRATVVPLEKTTRAQTRITAGFVFGACGTNDSRVRRRRR